MDRNAWQAGRWPAAAVGRLHASWPKPSAPAAFPAPPGHTPVIISKSNCSCSGPSHARPIQAPAQPAVRWPHPPRPAHTRPQAHPAQSPTFSGTDPVSRLLPAPEQSSSSLLPCLARDHLTL